MSRVSFLRVEVLGSAKGQSEVMINEIGGAQAGAPPRLKKDTFLLLLLSSLGLHAPSYRCSPHLSTPLSPYYSPVSCKRLVDIGYLEHHLLVKKNTLEDSRCSPNQSFSSL